MHADYVIVGTGSAGAVLANRLSADGATTVVALEAGPKDKDKFVHIPAAFAKLFRTAMDWDYLTEPQKELNGREIFWPRGKMLGGSSSMNAMMWVRGFAADYDDWAVHAGSQWSYAEVLDYFRRIENTEGASAAHEGTQGPLRISRQRSPRPSTAAWLTAVQQAGYRLERPNLPQPEGFCETLVTQRRGARWSTADAYLRPAIRRRNLLVVTGATATRVIVDGHRAVAVEFEQDGLRHLANARREVVLCGGAINTPQLLMLSGIGDREQLEQHGIHVVAHSPEVGENLQDHLVTPLGFDIAHGSLFAAEKPLELVNYLLRRRGMLTSNIAEAYGFVRSRPELALPDLELLFAPAPFFDEGIGDPYTGHAVVMGPILLKPESRGKLMLRSADPHAKPVIDPRYLTDPGGVDHAAMMAGLRMCAQIAGMPAMADVLGRVARPLNAQYLDDETLEAALATCSHTLYHPVGTCRMGSDDASVVDPALRVRGVDRLRVADASVMPSIIRGHTHAPSVLIGEKAADLIRA
jgi:choline dehydrogenase